MRTFKQTLQLIDELEAHLNTLASSMGSITRFNEDEYFAIIDKLQPLLTNLLGVADVDVVFEIETGDSNESIQGETTNRNAS